jgi:hypothetical protein
MADSDISGLTANTTPAVGDLLAIVDDPAGSAVTQKITASDFLKVVNGLTEDTSPDNAADFLLSYDTSASAAKKVKPENIVVSGGGKGRGEILSSSVPLTLGAPIGFIDSGSSPVDSFPYFEFGDSALAYVDFYCRLMNYQGGGLTVDFNLLRTTAAAAAGYYFQAAIRRIANASDDITASHTYDYNSVTVNVPAGPPAAGIPMEGTITFTDGADMDSLADNEMFVLRFRRDPTHANDNAGDAARVLATITIRET